MAKAKTPTKVLEDKDLDVFEESIMKIDDVVDIINTLDEDDARRSHIMFELGRAAVKLRQVYVELQDLQDKWDHRITSFTEDI